MEIQNSGSEVSEVPTSLNQLRKVTPLSKYLAMALFIILPFIGGYIGYQYAPEKIVEVERAVTKQVEPEQEKVFPDFIPTQNGTTVAFDANDTFFIKSENEGFVMSNFVVSPNKAFVFYSESLPSDSHGGKSIYIYDVKANESHQIEFVDDAIQYDLVAPNSPIYDMRLMSSGKARGWSIGATTSTELDLVSNGKFLYEVQSTAPSLNEPEGVGYVVFYESPEPDKPWVLKPAS